jgi:hypothetical protein
MKEESAIEFFREKREWSKYKDLILDYHLKPYLAKDFHRKCQSYF